MTNRTLLRDIALREELTHDGRRAALLAELSEHCGIPRWRLWFAVEFGADALTAMERIRVDCALSQNGGDDETGNRK